MNRIKIIAILLILVGISANGQTLEDLIKSFDGYEGRLEEEFERFRRQTQNEHDEFQRQSRQEFETFRRQAQKEFGEFLKQSWQEFELMQGVKFPAIPEPVTPRMAEPETFNSMVRLPDSQASTSSVSSAMKENVPLPKPSSNNPSVKYDDTNVPFFGSMLRIPFDRKFAIRLRSTKETDVGDFWVKLADADFLFLIYSCRLMKDALGLNDWGYYQLVREVAKRIYSAGGMDNERTLFTAFILDETGYDVRIARNVDHNKLALMSVFESKLYFTPFLEMSGKRYYIVGESNNSGRIASYHSYTKEEKRRIGLIIDKPFKLKNDPGTFEIPANIIGIPLKITYNRNAIDFYNTIPVTDLEVYFNSWGSAAVQQSFEEVLKPVIGIMNEKDATSTLLRLMHHAFQYKTDQEQFGYERPFFFEELFSYPYNNCKDRSVLFAFLVRQMVGLQVLGLKYPGHVATAVRFNGSVNGHYINFGGDSYIICDPTYINATIGQCMADYITVSAEPLIIHH